MAVSKHTFDPTPSPDRAFPKAIACLRDTIESVATGGASVFIIGERGTRKELVAQGVHALSARARAPFVFVSRPELTEEFIERALFGSGKHPDTDQGYLVEAEGGTLYLNEVCDFSLATQARLARALDAQRAQHGGDETKGVRLVAASIRTPESAIHDELLHPELYDHLRVFLVRVPPLRERKSEILDLVHHCLAAHARAVGIPVPRMSDAAISRLIAYHWPGNVHELEQSVAHALVMANGKNIEERHLPPAIAGGAPSDDEHPMGEDSLQTTLESVERALIEEALRASHGNQAKAAHSLGITERLMGLRVKKYGIESRHFRHGMDE